MAKKIEIDIPSSMWKKTWEALKEYFENDTFSNYIKRAFHKPFVIVEDEKDKLKRVFLSQEDADLWFNARNNNMMTEEIARLEFAGSTIPGTEQYKLSFSVLNADDAGTYGSQAKLRFTFSTIDTLNNNRPTEEPIEVFFTFTSDVGTKQFSKIFSYSENIIEIDITDYIEPDENQISCLVRGRTSGLSLTQRVTYTAVYLPFSSNFDLTEDRKQGQAFGIPYSVSGVGTKEVEFVIDSGTPYNDTVYAGTANKTYTVKNTLAPGLHSLQMKAFTHVNNKKFESKMLYFEFVVSGDDLDLTTTIIKSEFPSGTPYFMERKPGLIGEQYVDYKLEWAFFSTSKPNAIILWKTKLNGVETIVGSREIDEKEGNVGVMPDPVEFQPDAVGEYDLYACVKGEEEKNIGQYTINVVPNTAGLREAEGYTMKLDARGRSNSEPSDTRSDWSNNGFKTYFNDRFTFDGLAGYTGKAVRLDNGAACYNEIKPFAVENGIISNGGAVVFHFRTRNIEDENAPLVEIGDPNAPATAYFAIYGKRVLFRPSNGKALEYEFASEEDTHLAVVVNPKSGVTDPQMMYFIFNGVQAPELPYGNTAVFNIGSYADKDDTNGMIFMGDKTNKAAIDIYGVRVYPNPLSMWEGINNYVIDRGQNIAQMMRKNDLFVNNDFARPNINKMKEQYRVLEVVGTLDKLEESNKKESFFCSVRYTDPFAPKFNFERLDGGAFIKTAGQSRLEDKMAKSFHLDMNENDAQALYQDGKLCYKNRFIFAENNIAENKVRIDLCGADSSICRNASHMKMVNKYYPYIQMDGKYILRTPPQEYVLSSQWSRDMAEEWGGTAADYPWVHNINLAPDSVPIIVVWHAKEDDPIQVYGLAQMTEEKKAPYANGCHSIYLKEKLSDGTFDPFDRLPGTKGNRGWDNEGVMEVEYVNPSDLTNGLTIEGLDDEATRDYSFELCFPKKKDMADGGVSAWNTFKTEYLAPVANASTQEQFDAIIENVIYLPSFVMYYNKVMDKKCNDSLLRNLHVVRYNFEGKWLWFARWWDVDVCCGLFQSNAMGVDPETDRNTKDSNGNYVMSGHDMRLWNMLEKNKKFIAMRKDMASASFHIGWTAETEIAEQDKITNAFSESLYNLDGLLKFLYAYRKGNDYMVRMQGSSVPYRHGFIKASYAYNEAMMAIGSYAARSASFRATDATFPCAVKMEASAKWRFGLGTTTTNIVTGIEKNPDDGEFSLQIPEGMTLGRDFLSVYGADKLRMLDISDFCKYLSVQINLGNLTQIQRLYIGYRDHEALKQGGFNQDATISFTGINLLSRLMEVSVCGLAQLQSFDIEGLTHLKRFYASGTGLKIFRPANGTKFDVLELPDTLQTVECRNVTLGNLSFWESNVDDNSLTQMPHCPATLLNVSLVGMGEDVGAHSLVSMWCNMLSNAEYLINTAQITYRNINWMHISKDVLFTLARIPAAQRNLTGYVFCDEPYTIEEQHLLTTAFGENVFDPNDITYTLVCDSNGEGFSCTGVGEGVSIDSEGNVNVLQGCTAKLIASGFPVSASNKKNYRWRIWIDGEWTIPNDDMPVYNLPNGATLNTTTGEFVTVENEAEEVAYQLECYDITTFVSGNVVVKIVPRTYPNKAAVSLVSSQSDVSVIDGVMNIIARGAYLFGADNSLVIDGEKTEFTGNLTEDADGFWEVEGLDNAYASRDTSKENDRRLQFCLSVTKLPDEDLLLTMKYKSKWKNGTEVKADDVKIALVSVIQQLLIRDSATGNIPLFNVIEAMGISHAQPASYSSMELKNLIGKFKIPADSGVKNFRSTKYNILSYLPNVTELDCEGCDTINEDIDVRKMKGLSKANVSGLSKIRTLDLSLNPRLTDISAINCDVLLEIKATEIATNVTVDKASVFVPDGVVESMRQKVGDEKIEPSSDWGATALMWDDGTRIRFDDNNTVIL